MSYHFSQALEAAFSAASCLVGEPSAPWKSTPIAPKSSCSAKMMGICHRSQSGMMFVLSTDTRGAELLTWFLEASRARTSAPQGRALESTGSAVGCGRNTLASLARYDRVSCSWKTPQCSLVAGLDEFSETWPRWGLMRDGECWRLPTLELHTCERESGSWPTPKKWDAVPMKLAESPEHWLQQRDKHAKNGVNKQFPLAVAVKMFPTPCSVDSGSYFNRSKSSGAAIRPTLGAMAKFNLWPTPNCMDAMKARSPEALERAKKKGGCSNLKDTVPEVLDGGTLNPPWVEWLMGWPIGWTELPPSGTDKFRQWLDLHGRRYMDELATMEPA